MKRLILGILLFVSFSVSAQYEELVMTEKVWRVNFINPAIGLEMPYGQFSAVSYELGIGYNGAMDELTYGVPANELLYDFAPFFDTQYKWFYSLKRRHSNGKKVEGNSANFFSTRVLIVGPSIESNFNRISEVYFQFGPTWGIQRSFGQFHGLLDFGPQMFVDIDGNIDWFPLLIQLNIGLNL